MMSDWTSLRVGLVTFLFGWFFLFFFLSLLAPIPLVEPNQEIRIGRILLHCTLKEIVKTSAACKATVCNGNDSGLMTGKSRYEVYYRPSGNPKEGTVVGTGEVPILSPGQCATLRHEVDQLGNYMIKFLQRPGHPGQGEVWSEQCSVSCLPSPKPSPSIPPCACTPKPSDKPTPKPSPLPSPLPSPQPSPTPTSSPVVSPSPTLTPSPKPTSSPTPHQLTGHAVSAPTATAPLRLPHRQGRPLPHPLLPRLRLVRVDQALLPPLSPLPISIRKVISRSMK